NNYKSKIRKMQYNPDPYNQYNPNQQNPPYDEFMGGSGHSFSEIKIRHAFIRKTYSIVSLQLLITLAITAVLVFVESAKSFFYANQWILWLAMIGTFIIMIMLACCESINRSYPINMILLMVFTVLESILIGCISAQYKTDTIFIALGVTAVVVIALTIFAFQTKIDFTGFGIYLFVFALILMLFGLVAIILRSNLLHILYAAFGAGLFSMYLIFDTQLMIGGKHKYSISPEDYIFAALNIYVDIINLFLLILRLVSAAKD
ncbi:unnamed protein product, partial [Brachionus calyciflorus]